MPEMIAIGVDIGGSHITCAAVDIASKKMIRDSFSTVNIDNQAPAGEILDGWASALKETIKKTNPDQLRGIGFAMPGPFDYDNGIALFKRVKKFESLYGINITEELKRRLDLPDEFRFRYINDATAFAIGEGWAGEGSRVNKVIALTLGTGFGSAFLDKGIPVVKGDNVPKDGCVWYMPFRNGMADDYISTRWFLSEFEKRTGKKATGVLEIAKSVIAEPGIGDLFEEFGSNMAEIILPHALKFGTDAIILGGNISKAYHLFGNAFEEKLDAGGMRAPVLISALGEDAAILGSARLVDPAFHEKIING